MILYGFSCRVVFNDIVSNLYGSNLNYFIENDNILEK